MRNKAHDLAAYTFREDEPFLLDANVWLYLFPAPSGSAAQFAFQYSTALKSMLTAKVRLVMDAMVLSEYLNRYCRIEWGALHKNTYRNFKDFRKSAAFQTVGNGAATFARKMLTLCNRHDHPFASADVGRVLADFEAGSCDFNDGLLAETCRHNKWRLVTNDGDFTEGGIDLLTTNPKLLKACP